MSDRYFEITPTDHRVVNCIIWDGVAPYTPPHGLYLMEEGEVEGMQVGWQKVDGVWTDVRPKPEEVGDTTT